MKKQYKTEIKKYKHLKNRYKLTVYLPEYKLKSGKITNENSGLSEFLYFHLNKKYHNLPFYRSYSNEPGHVFGIEELSKSKALVIKKYLDGLVGKYFTS